MDDLKAKEEFWENLLDLINYGDWELTEKQINRLHSLAAEDDVLIVSEKMKHNLSFLAEILGEGKNEGDAVLWLFQNYWGDENPPSFTEHVRKLLEEDGALEGDSDA